jgi:glycosyltransferase involved in cell wall biosynthesis
MKGVIHLMEAVAKIRTERPDVHVTVIGKPNPDGPVMQTIRRLDLERIVEFVYGVTDERIVELYAEAELAVVPSLYEGFSLPAVEAMAAGVPLVATTGGAVGEVVGRDGTTAALVPPGDPGALATMILELMDDPERRAAMGEAGRTRVVDMYSWQATAERTVDQYRMLLAETKVRKKA